MVAYFQKLTSDANIWFDIRSGGIIDPTVNFANEWVISDLIYSELDMDMTRLLKDHRITVAELNGTQLEEVINLAAKYPRISPADASLIIVARENASPLITGDNNLKKVAKGERLEVHGTLWLIRQMVNFGKLEQSSAILALEKMLIEGRRLPERECSELLKEWGAKPRNIC